MKRKYVMLTVALGASLTMAAQSLENTVSERLAAFFDAYQTDYAHIGASKLDHVVIDNEGKALQVYTNEAFGAQPFTEENTAAIYRSVRQILPGPVNYYKITVYADGKPIEELVPNVLRRKKDKERTFGRISYGGDPWVKNASKPFEVTRGLEGHHIAVWQSHGKYYRNDRNEWMWQRPRLFCTTEDLFTQSFVVPYIIPMLENAGATVFTPRERDWQRHEVIVDNNTCPEGSRYLEVNYKKYRWSTADGTGFAQKYALYPDNHNPFQDGTARFIPTMGKAEKAFAEWIPNIPEKGEYAVYVSYRTLPQSISDAKYLVFHNGGVTEFKVNQQMGGGTWVYLGTFEFDKGMNDYGMVVLSNESGQKGVVCADAVRFGGGMGNILRGGATSGLPRYLEGARYAAQWAGMPYEVYSKSGGTNDYNDDINVRSLMTNYLNGGSVYNPDEKGLGVPFELTLALHSDAGFKTDDSLVGSLGIYTTDYHEGKLACGTSRYASRDLADMVLTGLQRDISARFGVKWARRSLWNRNYSETRMPSVPSMILELLSHQNFADLQLGHQPDFKFTVGRSVYKSVLKYLAEMHGTNYVVQPLPVDHFAIREGKKKNTFELSWMPQNESSEPTAAPQGYVVYTRVGYGGFDNGTYVNGNHFTFEAEPGLVYSFKVTAVNRGGESFPSEILSAYKAKRSRGTVLIVNAFDLTSGPGVVRNALQEGFDLRNRPGIPYLRTPAYCGFQQVFDRSKAGIETEGGLGYSGDECEGRLIAGNTFDYAFVHGKAIQKAGHYSFVSCSDEAFENESPSPEDYYMVDLLFGADNKGFSTAMQHALSNYLFHGGKLLLSGSAIGTAMNNYGRTQPFLSSTLKYSGGGTLQGEAYGELFGTNITFSIPRLANERMYAVPASECILPEDNAYPVFLYTRGRSSAGIAYKGNYRTFVLGFPFESIPDAGQRTHVMQAVLGFFRQ